MILSNSKIRESINSSQLLIDSDDNCIKNCSYKIRIGKLIEPKSGNEIKLPYTLKPSKVVLFESAEKINLPENLTASYSALFSVSSKGILLINSSMIEPCYKGHLSGVLLNFSSKKYTIKKLKPIAKLNFMEVNGTVDNPSKEAPEDDSYSRDLIDKAENYDLTFLNIDTIKKEVEEKIFSKIRRYLTVSGIIVTLLILFATLEPLFHRWIWENTGVPTITERVEFERFMMQMNEKKNTIEDLQHKVDSLEKTGNLNDKKK